MTLSGQPISPLDDEKTILETVRFIEAMGITDAVSFTCSLFTKATLPHSSRGAESGRTVLHNGDLTVTITSTSEDGKLPYGHYARLVLMWLTREICVRHADPNLPPDVARVIPLKGAAHRVLRETGIIKPNQRASKPQYEALATQIERIAATTISITYASNSKAGAGKSRERLQIADTDFLWKKRNDESGEFGEASNLVLSQSFYDWVPLHSVPLSTVHIFKLYRSPLALDLYCWAVQRLHTHRGDTRVTWEQLRGQLGASYPSTAQGNRDFKKKARAAIQKIKTAWPEAGISEWPGGVRLIGKNTPIDAKHLPPIEYHSF